MRTGSGKANGLILALTISASIMSPGTGASAQTNPVARPVAAPIDPAHDPARLWFEALPQAERRAIQDALVWTGDYKGTSDANFGKRTRDAIAAFAARAKKPADGTLDAVTRASLLASADKARAALRFALVIDSRTGIRIGVPQKLMPKSRPLGAGTIWEAADGSASLRTDSSTNADLAGLYARTLAGFPGAQPSYKVLRPDFFVVTGEESGRTTFTRYALGMANGQPVLRGFTLTYGSAVQPTFEIVTIAIANSFDPFPAPVPAPGANPDLAAPQNQAPPQPPLVATGVVVGPGLVLTSYSGCGNPAIQGRPTTVRKRDETSGLTLLEAPGINPARPVAVASASDGGEALVLEMVSPAGPASAGQGPAAGLEVSAARLVAAGDKPLVTASLQQAGAGAAIFSRQGELIGFAMLPRNAAPRLVAGIVPESAYPVAAAGALFPGTVSKSGDKTAGQILAANRAAVLPVTCSDRP